MRMRRSHSHHLPLAIARGETHAMQKLLQRQLSSLPSAAARSSTLCRSNTMDFCYRGHTFFGNTITYEISPLGLAVCFRKWSVFQALLAAGVDPNREQKVLLAADRKLGQHYVAQFASALELFLYAAVRPTYFPPALPDTEFMSILSSLLEHGADPGLVRAPFVRRLCSAVCLDLWLHVWRTDASTGIAREAASLLRCLVKNGLAAPRNLFLDYHTLDDNLYLVLLACLDRENALAARPASGAGCSGLGRGWRHGAISDASGANPDAASCLPRSKLRSTLILMLNLFLSNGVHLPRAWAVERAPRLLTGAASTRLTDPQSAHRVMEDQFVRRPLKLALLARRVVRKQCIGSANFSERLARVGGPQVSDELRRYIAYLEEKDLAEELEALFAAAQAHRRPATAPPSLSSFPSFPSSASTSSAVSCFAGGCAV